MTSDRKRFPIALSVATVVAVAILCGLGTWQLKRLAWKQGLLHKIAALQHAPARPLSLALAQGLAGRDAEFTRVEADCPGIDRAPAERVYALNGGDMGARLLSACRMAGTYDAILVDRGWTASTAAPAPAADPVAAARVVGVLRRPDPPTFVTPRGKRDGQWFWRDIPGIAAALGAKRPAPYILAAETATNPQAPELKPLPLPAEIPNRHLEYALTWFGLAVVLAVIYGVMLRRRLR